MGCFLLIDWMVSIQNQLNGSVVLELGAGTGLASIAVGLMTNVAKVFCTGVLTALWFLSSTLYCIKRRQQLMFGVF
jgi:hypothetical protein